MGIYFNICNTIRILETSLVFLLTSNIQQVSLKYFGIKTLSEIYKITNHLFNKFLYISYIFIYHYFLEWSPNKITHFVRNIKLTMATFKKEKYVFIFGITRYFSLRCNKHMYN